MSAAHQVVFDVILGGRHPLHAPKVRLMRPSDTFPEAWGVGLDKLGKLDCEWIWVVERDGEIEGVVLCAPCHGMAFIYRLYMAEGSRTLLRLLRGAMRDLRRRGILGFMTFIDPTVGQQERLLHIIQRLGGKQVGPPHVVVASPMPKEGV